MARKRNVVQDRTNSVPPRKRIRPECESRDWWKSVPTTPHDPSALADTQMPQGKRPGIRVSRGTQKPPSNKKRRMAPKRPMVGIRKSDGKTVWLNPDLTN